MRATDVESAVEIMATEGRVRGWFLNCAADGKWGVAILRTKEWPGSQGGGVDVECVGAGASVVDAVNDALGGAA